MEEASPEAGLQLTLQSTQINLQNAWAVLPVQCIQITVKYTQTTVRFQITSAIGTKPVGILLAPKPAVM